MNNIARPPLFSKNNISHPFFMLGLIVLYILRFIPYRIKYILAYFLSLLAIVFIWKKNKTIYINLSLCFPDLSQKDRKKIARQHLQELAQMVMEYGTAFWGTKRDLIKTVTIKGLENFKKHEGKPIIFLSGHFSATELALYRLSLEAPAMAVIYAPQTRYPNFDRMILEARSSIPNSRVFSRKKGLLAPIKAIKQKIPLLFLPDQGFGEDESIFVPFFGIQTATSPALHKISNLTKAIIIPVIPHRNQQGIEVEVLPAWEDFPSQDAIQDTQKMNIWLEEQIRKQPSSYFWTHKRFRTRPNKLDSFYKK